MHGLIEYYFKSSKQLYCSFVDLTKAFDGVDRNALWYKLNKSGVSSKIIRLVRNMYDKIKLCVKNHKITKNLITERMESSINEHHQLDLEEEMYFSSCTGVFQGESLSPFLFSMYVNDLDNYLAQIIIMWAYN